ncbi:hypothetical protein Tco_0242890 [Tanacetum coccineum]
MRKEVEGYTEEIVQDFEQRLDMIFGRHVNRDEGQKLFSRYAWRRLFEIRGPLVREYMLEFFSTCRMSDTELSNSGRGQAPEKGKKSGVRLSRGYFIGRLAAHFSLVSNEGLIGLTVIAREPPMIDMDELVKLIICVAEGSPDVDEGAQAIPAPVQVPQPPPATAPTRTMAQSLSRLEEYVHSLCGDMGEQREVLDSMSHDFARCTTWTRCKVRKRTREANTSAAPLDEDQLDP